MRVIGLVLAFSLMSEDVLGRSARSARGHDASRYHKGLRLSSSVGEHHST